MGEGQIALGGADARGRRRRLDDQRIIEAGNDGREANHERASLADLAALQGERATMALGQLTACLLYTSPSPRDLSTSRMPSSA